MTIVASNSLTLSNVNDGTITHTAYANSADGTLDFTPDYKSGVGLDILNITKWAKNAPMTNSTYSFTRNADNSFKVTGMGASGNEVLSKSFSAKVGDKLRFTVSYTNRLAFQTYDNHGLQFVANDAYTDSLDITSKIVLPKTITGLTEYQLEYTAKNSNVWMELNFGNVVDQSQVDFDVKIEVENLTNPVKYAYMGTYTDTTITDSTNYADYTWLRIKGNDGTITHTAWSWSADGADRFTLDYPNLNLGDNTKTFVGADGIASSITGSIRIDSATQKTQDGDFYYLTFKPTRDGYDWFRFFLIPHTVTPNMTSITVKPNTQYTFSVLLKGTGQHMIYAYQNWTAPNTPWYLQINLTSDWKLYTFTVTSKDVIPNNPVQFFIRSNNGTEINLKLPKVEEGSVATPYMPSKNEVKTSDYPNYIGTYSDNNVESSSDYKKYQWAIFKGQNSNAYTAYSWSSDGTDRFTTTYPNLNLLDGTTKPFIMGYGIPNTTWDTTNQVSGISLPITVSANEVLPQGNNSFPYMYISGTTYTQSIYISTDAPLTGTSIKFTWFTGKYGHNQSGVDNLVKVSNNVYRATSTTTWSSSNSSEIGRNADIGNLTQVFDFTKGTFLQFYKPKLELGSTATPWTPSESEAQEQWQDAIPMYVGVGEKDSQNPTDYRWQLNPRYVQASSDSGLSNKAGVDDLASVANTANDALVQAQNAVSNEDYTSWLEHDYQTTIDNLQDVSAQNQEDIKNIDDRTTIVEGFYGEMKVKWNFIDESFSFSEEGMFISNAQSKMSIQITSDKIVFWDNNVDVAFITGEVLNIQKGVFLESATIGNHLITKFSDDSPVTIIRYVGGIT